MMLPVSLTNTIFVVILLTLLFVIFDSLYTIVQQVRLYKAYTRHDPCIFTVPLDQLEKQTLYDLTYEHYVASIAILHVEACDRLRAKDASLLPRDEKCRRPIVESRFLRWRRHLSGVLAGILRLPKETSKQAGPMKEIGFVSSHAQVGGDGEQPLRIHPHPSVASRSSSSTSREGPSSHQVLFSDDTNSIAATYCQGDSDTTQVRCVASNKGKDKVTGQVRIKSNQSDFPVMGLYLGEALTGPQHRSITLLLRKTTRESGLQKQNASISEDTIKNNLSAKRIGHTTFSAQLQPKLQEHTEENLLRGMENFNNHKVCLQRQTFQNTNETPLLPSENVMKSRGIVGIHRDGSTVVMEALDKGATVNKVVDTFPHFNLIGLNRQQFTENAEPATLEQRVAPFRELCPCYSTLFTHGGVNREGLGSLEEAKLDILHPESGAATQDDRMNRVATDSAVSACFDIISNNGGSANRRSRTGGESDGGNNQSSRSGAIFIEARGSEIVCESIGKKPIPQVGLTRYSKSGPEVSRTSIVEGANSTVCAEIGHNNNNSVSLGSTSMENAIESLTTRSCLELCDKDSQGRGGARSRNTRERNQSATQLCKSILYNAGFPEGYLEHEKGAFVGGASTFLEEQPITVRGSSPATQSAVTLPKAHDQRVAYILGADHDSLLRAITTDATRTFIHGFVNFVCFYANEVERETLCWHEAKKNADHFSKRYRRSMDSRSSIILSDEDIHLDSLVLNPTQEIDCQSVKCVQPPFADLFILSDVHSCYSDTSEHRFNRSFQINQKSETTRTKEPVRGLPSSIALRTHLDCSCHLENEDMGERNVNERCYHRRKARCPLHWMPLTVSASGQNYLIRPSCIANPKTDSHRQTLSCEAVSPLQELFKGGPLEARKELKTTHETVVGVTQPKSVSEELMIKKRTDKDHWYSFHFHKKRKFSETKKSHGKIEDKFSPSWLSESMLVKLGSDHLQISELALNALRSRLSAHLPPYLMSSETFFGTSFSDNSGLEMIDQCYCHALESPLQGCLNEDDKCAQRHKEWMRVNSREWTAHVGQFTSKVLFNNSPGYIPNDRNSAKRRRQRLQEGLHNLNLNKLVHRKRGYKVEAREDVPVALATLLFLPFSGTSRLQKTILSERDNASEKALKLEKEISQVDQLMFSHVSPYEIESPASYTREQNQAIGAGAHQSEANVSVPPELPHSNSLRSTTLRSHLGDSKTTPTNDRPGAEKIVDMTVPTLQSPPNLDETKLDPKVVVVADPQHCARVSSTPAETSHSSQVDPSQQRWDVVVLLYGATTSSVLQALLKAEESGLGIGNDGHTKTAICQPKQGNFCDINKSWEDFSPSCASRPSKNASFTTQGVAPSSKEVAETSLNTARTFSLPSCSNTQAFGNGFQNGDRSLHNSIPSGGSAYYEDSILSTSTSGVPSHQSVHQCQEHQPMNRVLGSVSHNADGLTTHKDLCADVWSGAYRGVHQNVSDVFRNRHKKKEDGQDIMQNKVAMDTIAPDSLQHGDTETPSPGTFTCVERSICCVPNNDSNVLEYPDLRTQESPHGTVVSDILAPVCDPIHFPQGLRLPVELIYARIGDNLYRVVKVVDQTFIQYREKRVLQSAEISKSRQNKREEFFDSHEMVLSEVENDKIYRMRSAFNILMNDIPRRSPTPVEGRRRPRRRPFSMNTALCESVYSISPIPSGRGQVERERVNMCWQCLANEARVIFLPCGHFSSCKKCSNRTTECHICQTKIFSTIALAD